MKGNRTEGNDIYAIRNVGMTDGVGIGIIHVGGVWAMRNDGLIYHE